mgnify:CR=1 FL=1
MRAIATVIVIGFCLIYFWGAIPWIIGFMFLYWLIGIAGGK